MKIRIQRPLVKQQSQAIANPSVQKKSSDSKELTPPKLSFQNSIAQLEEYSAFDDWGDIQYGYQPSETHRKKVESWIKLSLLDIYAALNKETETSVLYNLLEATSQANAKKSKTIKKLKDIRGLIQSRINTLKALKKGDATDEKIAATDEKTIASTWSRVPGKNVHFKHIEGNSLLTNLNLTTKIREVKEQDSHTERGSTGYDLFIPYSLKKGKHWYPVILDPILYVDIHVRPKNKFAKLDEFKPYYEEYLKMVEEHGGNKETALQEFAKKHTTNDDTTDIQCIQDATIYHEAGHVKEYQDKYEPLMSNFFDAASDRLKNYKSTEPNQSFMELARRMWKDYASDKGGVTHKDIIFHQIKAMIAKYEQKDDATAFDEYDSFSEVRDKVHRHAH